MSKKKLKEEFNKKETLHPGVLETDPAKLAAADKVMAIVVAGEDSEIPDELIAEAGGKALRNRHIFVFAPLNDGEGGFYATGTSIDYMRANKGAYDERMGLMQALLPADYEEACEMMWQFCSSRTVAEAARELRDMGFMWDEKEQRESDANCTGDDGPVDYAAEIAAVYAEIEPAPQAKPAAKAKRGSKRTHKR
jgi:hypothetical protein